MATTIRHKLHRDGTGPASRSAAAAATRQRSHPWRLQRSWDYLVAAHRLLLCYEVGSGSDARGAGAGGQTVRYQGDTD